MSKLIQQTVVFKASPHDVYEALMDAAKHAAFSGDAASISREVGGAYMAYGGYITGNNLELVPDRKIVQTWRAVEWPENTYSTVTFEFTAVPEGTRLDFTHKDVPAGTEAEYEQGWIDNYWMPMKTMFEGLTK